MLLLHCRHCWKKVRPQLKVNEEHIQASCPACNNWIKFLNRAECAQALADIIKNIKIIDHRKKRNSQKNYKEKKYSHKQYYAHKNKVIG